MRKLISIGCAITITITAAPAHAQLAGRLSAEPFIAYGFFGGLPESTLEFQESVAYGGRVAYQMQPQWGLFGTFQRANPAVVQTVGGIEIEGEKRDVDHWSAGVEFSYVPRGGAEGMLPILLEAGLGQARYEGGASDFAVNIGLASALALSPNFAIRYGVNDYISNYADNGVVNHVFARVGAELSF
ncbi:MAG: hypothetical protein WD766_07820 [Gemmatimonadota bacterium]